MTACVQFSVKMRWNTLGFTYCVVFSLLVRPCLCQEACYPPAGVAGIVVATIVVTAVVMGLVIVATWRYWKRRKAKKKKPEHSARDSSQKTTGDFAFDNPYFRDQEDDDSDSVHHGKGRASINNKSPLRSSKQSDMSSNKWRKSKAAKGHHFIFGGGGQSRKQRTMDDTYLAAEPERTVVALKGHDFTGLGFNICGNMRDGILVKDVLHRGPASESGRIKAGDRIISVTVSFTNIVYEDALTILSYASPYDVQLELERAPDKSSNMPSSPAGSKRLGSGSFSSSGPKLFHPLYRSQSIDDLTQIDRDTFPSHGFGPRRSQSVGVAAHKLAAHFKNSDTRLEEKDRPSTSAILSATGSLNEKMLANVIADGALHKCGLHWEKRFEDNLDGDVEDVGDSKTTAEASVKKSAALPKSSTSSAEEEKPEKCGEKSAGYYRRLFGGNSKRNIKTDNNGTSTESASEVQITAQIHQHSVDARSQRSKTMAEASDAVWQLEQSIRDAESDIDSSICYPWNGDVENTPNSRMSLRKNQKDTSSRDVDNDSNASGDSVEEERQRRKKKHRHKTSSLGDLSQLEDSVKESNTHSGKDKTADMDKERPLSASNLHNEQKSSRRNKKATNVSAYREQNISTESLKSKARNENDAAPNRNIQPQCTTAPQMCSNPNSSQFCNKERRMETSVSNAPHSPKLLVKSPKLESHAFHNEPSYQKVQHFQHPSSYSSSPNSSESRMNENRSSYSDRPDLIINSRNLQHQYIPNNVDSACDHVGNNRNRFSPHNYQQRPPYVEYQKSPRPPEQYHRYDIDTKRVEPPRSGPPPYYQALRKANPAGMFTQINPFQQPSNRQRNNFSAKPWMGKDLPANGGDHHYYSNPGQVTTTDSSGRPRNRMEPPPYPQKMIDSGHSKTVLISTFDSANNNNNNPAGNYRHMRK